MPFSHSPSSSFGGGGQNRTGYPRDMNPWPLQERRNNYYFGAGSRDFNPIMNYGAVPMALPIPWASVNHCQRVTVHPTKRSPALAGDSLFSFCIDDRPQKAAPCIGPERAMSPPFPGRRDRYLRPGRASPHNPCSCAQSSAHLTAHRETTSIWPLSRKRIKIEFILKRARISHLRPFNVFRLLLLPHVYR